MTVARFPVERHGFFVCQPQTEFTYELGKGPVRDEYAVLTVAHEAEDLKLEVSLGPVLPVARHKQLTIQLAMKIAAAAKGRCGEIKPLTRFDRRSAFEVTYVGETRQGLVTSVAGPKRIHYLISSVPKGAKGQAVEDLLFVQMGLGVL